MFSASIAMAKGTYVDTGSKIEIKLVTHFPITMVLILYSMLFLMVIIFNALVINSDNAPTIAFIVFNAFYIFFGLRSYFYLRKAVTNLMGDVEREMGF